MTDIYVRSTDGSDASDGLTWANAKATLTGAAAIDVAGDVIWVSDAHAESTAGAVTVALAGTIAAPVKVICGDDAAEPPTASATTATAATTGGNAFTISGTHFYVYGITFNVGDGASGASFNNSVTSWSMYEDCNVQLVSTNTGNRVVLSNSTDGGSRWKNCGFKFANASQAMSVNTRTITDVVGGSILAGGTAPTTMFVPGALCVMQISGMDLSNAASAANITASTALGVKFSIRNCKLPGSWSGSLNSSTPGGNSVYEMHNCDSTDTNYRYWRKTQYGEVTSETTVIRTGGASDGVTGLSWKMVSGADAEFPHALLSTGEVVRYNETTGSAITVTVEILHDSVTNLKDNEIWLDVQYLGTSGFPLGSFISDRVASVIGTSSADQTDSSETWTTTGLTNPNTQKLNVTFTPQEKGFIHATVNVALASKTVYIDPELTVS